MTSPIALDLVRPQPRILGALVAAYVALLPYKFEVASGLNFDPADCFMLLILLLAPGQLIYRKAAWSVWHFAILGIFAMGSIVAVLRFGALDQYELLNKDIALVVPFLSYFAITSVVTSWEDVRRLLRIFVWSVLLQNTVAVAVFLLTYFYGVENPFARYGGLRLSGMQLDPNAYGGLVAAAFVICEAGCLGENPLFKRPVLWFARLTLLMGLLFTFSRSGWIALAVGLLLLCALQVRAMFRVLLAGSSGAACVFLLMGHRFVPIFEEMASRPKQVQGRFDLIHSALQKFSNHPLFGAGIGAFRLAEGEIAHNTAMWFLADFGIIGFVVLAGFVAWIFVKAWSAYQFAPAKAQMMVLGLLVANAAMLGLAMGIDAFYQRHWWMVMGLIAASYCLTRPPHLSNDRKS
jgi:O-antigen ligase